MSKETYRRFDPWRPAPVEEKSRRTVIDSHYFGVDHVTFSSPESGPFERDLLHENIGDTIGVLAITSDGRIPFIEQYRLPTHRWTLEIPCGHAKTPGERPHDIAVRKLRDEAGYAAKRLTQFTRFINTPSFSAQHTVLFYATGLVPAPIASELGPETPRPRVRLYTPAEAYHMVVNGTIVDAKSVIAVLRMHSGLAIE
ncbi:MAG: NUDIX hydrolase [Bifidobacterium sp.]|jgi:ADP-ribose pyrophosphatase|nr:NUDIX hydrolase [Bifidobacterium sp.]